MKRAVAHVPLHGGKAPAWLFGRMKRLAGAITQLIVVEYGPAEMLARLADPGWFQAFGCVLGFDWHSSGLTTVTGGALKEAYRMMGADLGIHVAGGKGGTSRKTPREVEQTGQKHGIDPGPLVYASRMAAKVDTAAVQDGYDIYHHNLFFTQEGQWCVVQQGMNDQSGYARRYHWLGDALDSFVCEPHRGIAADAPARTQLLLNMVAAEADASRRASVEVVHLSPDKILAEVDTSTPLFMPRHHPVLAEDVDTARLSKVLRAAHEAQPTDFEQTLGLPGVGPKTIRSLALIAELIFDAPVSRRDPATSSYAHGGKDGHPFPVDRGLYDRNIGILEQAVAKSRVNPNDKDSALRRLARFVEQRGRGVDAPAGTGR